MWKRLNETTESWLARKREYENRYRRTKRNRLYRRAYAQRHPIRTKLQENALQYRRKLSAGKRAFLIDYKESHPCVDCGKIYSFYVMDLDHVRGEKVMNVSVMVSRGFNMLRFIEEIEKCDVVCANCHRVRTFTRGDHLEKAPLTQPAMDTGADA